VKVGSGVRVGRGVACAPSEPQPASTKAAVPINNRLDHIRIEVCFIIFVILSISQRSCAGSIKANALSLPPHQIASIS
jgi:hypothetical protein